MSPAAQTIELLFFDGCPNVGRARKNLRSALARRSISAEWKEWDLEMPDLPDRLRGYPSPTVLVDGDDVTGKDPSRRNRESTGVACRADGAPSVDAILSAVGSG